MTTMLLFAAALFLAALFFIWLPVFKFKKQQNALSITQKTLNIRAFETQISELEAECQAGRLARAEFEEIKAELERNLLSDISDQSEELESTGTSSTAVPVLLGVVLSVFVVLAGIGLYVELGRSVTLNEMADRQQLAERLLKSSPEQRLAIMQEAADKNLDNPEIWYALAQGYASENNFIEAGKAYEHLLAVTNHPRVMAEYAQMLFFSNNNQITEKVKALAEQAVQLQPDNTSALGLLGIDAFNKEQFELAADFWQKALDVSPDGAGADALRAGIAQTRSRASGQPTTSMENVKTTSLTVEVTLDERLKTNLNPETFVFVLAKAMSGPPMPLAVTRLQVKDLPATVELNDAMAMMPELTLSSFKEVQLIARVSLDGTPTAKPGDLQGGVSPVRVESTQTSIKININNVVE